MQTDTASRCFRHFSSVFCFCYYSHFLWCILVLLPLSGFIYCWISVTAKKNKPKPFLLMYFCLLQSPALSPLSANTWQTASKTKENMSTCNPASVWMLQTETCPFDSQNRYLKLLVLNVQAVWGLFPEVTVNLQNKSMGCFCLHCILTVKTGKECEEGEQGGHRKSKYFIRNSAAVLKILILKTFSKL